VDGSKIFWTRKRSRNNGIRRVLAVESKERITGSRNGTEPIKNMDWCFKYAALVGEFTRPRHNPQWQKHLGVKKLGK
jgi:hypothetical protein